MSATDDVFTAHTQLASAREVMSGAADRYRAAEQSGDLAAAQVAAAQYRSAEQVHQAAGRDYMSAMAGFDAELADLEAGQ